MADITNQLQAAAGAAGGGEAPATGYNFYIVGNNGVGELGNNDSTQKFSPAQLMPTSDWSQLSAGANATNGSNVYLVKTAGSLWSAGQNFSGQVGDGTTTFQRTPVQIGSGLGNFLYARSHNGGAFALETGGSMYCWGQNNTGILGQNDTTNRSSPVIIYLPFSSWPTDPSQLGVGNGHFIVAGSTGYLFGCGSNSNGQLGLNDTVNRSSPVTISFDLVWSKCAGGQDHSVAIRTNGTLWAWGANSNGQLGHNNTTAYSSPVQVGALSNWAQVSAGFFYSLAVKTDGTLWAWGYNVNGELGDGTTTVRSSPVQIGSDTNWSRALAGITASIAIKTNGTIWAWGQNNFGQLGQNSYQNFSSPVQIGTATNWASIANSGSNGVAVDTSSKVYGWGASTGFPLVNVSSPIQIGSVNNWTANAVAGSGYNLAIKTDNTLWAWGNNSVGQLGLNNLNVYSSPVQVGKLKTWSKVCASARTSAAIKTDGTLWMWGYNFRGTLGDNTVIDKSSPIQVGSATDWVTFAMGGFNGTIVAIKTNGTIWSWGENTAGKLGQNLNAAIHRSSPVQIGALSDWAQVGATQDSFSAIKTNGTLWGWGFNSSGQVGDNSVVSRSSPVQIGALSNWSQVAGTANAMAAIKTDGTLWAWGQNNFGQLGLNDTVNRSSPVQIGALSTWAQVASVSGNGGFVALKTDGTVWSWGANFSGNLGLNNTTNYSSPVQIGSLTNWQAVQLNNYGSTIGIFSS